MSFTLRSPRTKIATFARNTCFFVSIFVWAGCSGSSPEGDQSEVSLDLAEEGVGDTTTSPSQRKNKLVSRSLVPEGWLDPLSPGEDFFNPPQQEIAVESPTAQTTNSEIVRLLGIAEVGTDQNRMRKAILKIGSNLVYAAVGDAPRGIEVLSITDRSVNLQEGRKRWSLVLMNEPIVNSTSVFQMAPGARERSQARRGGSSNRSSDRFGARPTNEFGPNPTGNGSNNFAGPEFPGAPAMPPLPEMPEIDLPDFSELPSPEELREFPGMQNIPGLTGLPGF